MTSQRDMVIRSEYCQAEKGEGAHRRRNGSKVEITDEMVDLATEAFCERVVLKFAEMPADEKAWFRSLWKDAAHATLAAAHGQEVVVNG